MKDFFQTLQDAFPVLKTHPVLMARLFLAALIIGANMGCKGLAEETLRAAVFEAVRRIAITNRWLFVYQDGNIDERLEILHV